MTQTDVQPQKLGHPINMYNKYTKVCGVTRPMPDRYIILGYDIWSGKQTSDALTVFVQ